MDNVYILFILFSIITAFIIIVIIKLITKLIEKQEVNSILEFMKEETKQDKQVEDKFKECIKIIEQNKKE